MKKPQKQYKFNESELVQLYIKKIMDNYNLQDYLNKPNYKYKSQAIEDYEKINEYEYCRVEFIKKGNGYEQSWTNTYAYKTPDCNELTEWINKWLSEEGRKKLNNSLRQHKFRKDKNIKTLKITNDLLIQISYEAREHKQTIEVFLKKLVVEANKNRIEKDIQENMKK